MMMLRRTMMRRKTDPKTWKHTLCEPAQSKCTCTCHQKHFVQKFTGKMPDANPAASILREPAQSKFWARSLNKISIRGLWARSLDDLPLGKSSVRGVSFCARLRRRHAHGHFTRAILYGNLQEQWPRTPAGTSFCASLHSRNAHGHVTRGILCGNLQGKSRTLPRPPRLNTGPSLLP